MGPDTLQGQELANLVPVGCHPVVEYCCVAGSHLLPGETLLGMLRLAVLTIAAENSTEAEDAG